MVDSLRQTGRIGVVTPSGHLRTVKRQNRPKKDPQKKKGDETITPEDDSAFEDVDDDQQANLIDTEKKEGISSASQNTGRRINVRI